MRFAPLSDRDQFNPLLWEHVSALSKSATFAGWWEFDLDLLALADGVYEYEFVANGTTVAADPYAEDITRFGGYRGIFTIAGGKRVAKALSVGRRDSCLRVSLPQNNQIVIYEMPIKWMSSDPGENAPLVELGTFDEVIFEHLDDLAGHGCELHRAAAHRGFAADAELGLWNKVFLRS